MQQLNKPATKAARGAQHIAGKHFEQVRRAAQGVINSCSSYKTQKHAKKGKMLIMDKYNYWASQQ
jgi:hypothetical protein